MSAQIEKSYHRHKDGERRPSLDHFAPVWPETIGGQGLAAHLQAIDAQNTEKNAEKKNMGNGQRATHKSDEALSDTDMTSLAPETLEAVECARRKMSSTSLMSISTGGRPKCQRYYAAPEKRQCRARKLCSKVKEVVRRVVCR